MTHLLTKNGLSNKRIRSEEQPLVVGVETNPNNENTYNFVQTLINNDWDYEIIGINKPWKGFVSKIEYFEEYLKTLSPEKIVVLSDTRDVFCVRSPKHFINAFQKFQKPLLVSLEIFCQGQPDDSAVKDSKNIWQCVPINQYWKHQTIKPTLRRYVNSGLIVGKTKDLLEHYNWIHTTNWKDDQAALGDYMNNFPDKVAADINADVLHTSGFGVNAAAATKNQWYDSPSFAELTGKLNFFLHIPGAINSKAQKKIYNITKKLISDYNVSNAWLCEGYDYDENTKNQWENAWYDPLPIIK